MTWPCDYLCCENSYIRCLYVFWPYSMFVYVLSLTRLFKSNFSFRKTVTSSAYLNEFA
jgi:hypothetical protein